MKKILLITLAACFGLAQNTLAADRKVRETVETTRSPDGTESTVQDSQSITRTEDESEKRLSKGGLFIEPLIFASQEDESIETSTLPVVSSDTEGTARGYGVGLRFGGHISEVFLLGIDGRYSKVRLEDSFYDDADADVYNIAPMIGLQTPLWGIRVMAGYVVAGENNPESGAGGVDLKFKEANGWRLGAGVHVGPIGINLEYQDLTYNSTEIESLGPVAINDTTSVDASSQGYALSVSFPIEL